MRSAAGCSICLAVLAVTLSLASSTSGPSQFERGPLRLDIMGGPGGSPFEHTCGPGRILSGVAGFTGVWLDNVQAVCGRPREDGRGVSDMQPEGPIFGANRPANRGANCPSGTVFGLSVRVNSDRAFLGSVSLRCGQGAADAVMSGTGRVAASTGQECPAGMVGVGIHGRAGLFLDAVGLICGVRPASAPALDALLGKEASFQSFNFPDRFIRHRGLLGFAEPIPDPLGKKDATFKIVRGLAGPCFSLESQNHADHFLRHEGFRVKLAPRTDNALFRKDATFCIVGGLAGASGISFAPLELSDHFVRHRNSELWVDRYDNTELFRKDATFQITQPGGGVILR